MAWQLIYTSAPRLLEAGRSGFGTVARHRDIPPLMVAAVERISQFSRQPGLDPARVIYAHRIMTFSGQRYHVLSCIRDAGADYTGRTNHLAHHLIADSQEVVTLANSSADVLLQMPWTATWTDQPRWLEAHETIPLSSFPPSVGSSGAHWSAVTGNPRHAQLLANADAAHACYLITPQNTDLRPLLAESLSQARERRWKVAYTTSLQPSDEPSDFRWLGLEADSPLRGGCETSGRIVLDLSRPQTLPSPPASAPAATRIERASAAPQLCAESIYQNPAEQPSSTASAPIFAEDRWAKRKQQSVESAETRYTAAKPTTWIWVAAAIALFAVGAGVGGAVLYRRSTLKSERADLVARLPDFARTGPKGEIALDGIRWSSRYKANALAAAADAVTDKLEIGRLDDLDIQPLQLAANSAEAERMDVSAYRALLNVASEVVSRRDEAVQPKPLGTTLELDTALLQKLTTALPAGAGFRATRDELQHLWSVREAEALYKALVTNSAQKLSLQTFRQAIEELDHKTKGGLPVESLEKVRAIVNDWGEVAANKRIPEKSSWPVWLRTYARQSSAIVDRPEVKLSKQSEISPIMAEAPKISSYLAIGVDNLREFMIAELGAKMRWHLTENGRPSTLVVINQSIKKGPYEPVLFSIDSTRQVLIPEDGSRTLGLPAVLSLSTSDEQAKPLAEIRIVDGSVQTPLFPPRRTGLSREGGALRIDLSFVPRTANARWLLQLPDAPADQLHPIEDGVVSLRDVLRVREQTIDDWQVRLRLKQRSLAELTNPKDIEDKLAKQCLELETLFPDAAKSEKVQEKTGEKEKREASTPAPPSPTGGVLPHFGTLLKRVSNQIDDLTTSGQRDSLHGCGVALENAGKNQLKPREAVVKASSLIQGMFGFKSEESRKQWKDKLEKLKAACTTAAAFVSIGSEESKTEKMRLSNEIAGIERQLATMKSDPLRNGGLPKGDYLCLVEAGGLRVKVIVFHIP